MNLCWKLPLGENLLKDAHRRRVPRPNNETKGRNLNMKTRRTLKAISLAVALAASIPAWADRVYDADVVVVGAGASGTVAAVSALEGGLKVVMLEKNAFPGGAGNYMEGSFAAESFMQKAAGVKLTKQQAFKAMADYHHWRINAPLVQAFVNKSADTIQWVWDHGVHWKEVKTAWRDKEDKTWHIYPSAGSLPKAMVEQFKKGGGTLLLSTPAKKLLMEDGRAAGVEAVNADGEKVTVKARYVILATGGYNWDTDFVKKTTGIDMIPVGNPGRTGDGIRMAFSAGAVGDNIGPMMINGAFMPAEGEAICNGPNKELRAIFRQGLLYVDGTGNRFFDEELTIDWPTASNAIARSGEWTYVIFDAKTKKELETEGKGYLNQGSARLSRKRRAEEALLDHLCGSGRREQSVVKEAAHFRERASALTARCANGRRRPGREALHKRGPAEERREYRLFKRLRAADHEPHPRDSRRICSEHRRRIQWRVHGRPGRIQREGRCFAGQTNVRPQGKRRVLRTAAAHRRSKRLGTRQAPEPRSQRMHQAVDRGRMVKRHGDSLVKSPPALPAARPARKSCERNIMHKPPRSIHAFKKRRFSIRRKANV